MILSLAQVTPCWNNPTATLKKVRTYVANAVEGDASFIVFPEQILTGWNPQDTAYATYENGSEILELCDIARDFSMGILGSFREKTTEKPRNTCIAIDANGKIRAKYAKIHLFSPAEEDQHYTPGNTLGLFQHESCTIGIAICYDLRFAPLFQAYREKNVDLMLVPSAWPASRMKHFQLFTTSRAAEFQMFVASVNTVGNNVVDVYTGGSCIAGPDGTIRAQGSDREELIFYDINVDETDSLRQAFPVHTDMQKTDYSRL